MNSTDLLEILNAVNENEVIVELTLCQKCHEWHEPGMECPKPSLDSTSFCSRLKIAWQTS